MEENKTVAVKFGLNFKDAKDLAWIEEEKARRLELGFRLVEDNEKIICWESQCGEFHSGWWKENGRYFSIAKGWVVNLLKRGKDESKES